MNVLVRHVLVVTALLAGLSLLPANATAQAVDSGASPIPESPTDLVAKWNPTKTVVHLSWSPPTKDAGDTNGIVYHIYRGATWIGTVKNTHAVDPDAVSGSVYWVQAQTSQGASGPSNPASPDTSTASLLSALGDLPQAPLIMGLQTPEPDTAYPYCTWLTVGLLPNPPFVEVLLHPECLWPPPLVDRLVGDWPDPPVELQTL